MPDIVCSWGFFVVGFRLQRYVFFFFSKKKFSKKLSFQSKIIKKNFLQKERFISKNFLLKERNCNVNYCKIASFNLHLLNLIIASCKKGFGLRVRVLEIIIVDVSQVSINEQLRGN